ncbi:MAG: sensor histidine kinase [Lachnospiraceae bacterium]
MTEQKKRGRLYSFWLSCSMKKKFCTFAGVVTVTIGLAILSNINTINYALYGFGQIMEDNVKSYNFLVAMSLESETFETYVRSRTPENREAYETACEKTRRSVTALPYDYRQIGATRYAQTWSIRSFYSNYIVERDHFLTMNENHLDYVEVLYRVYQMQKYMDSYARRLMQLTMQDGNSSYLSRVSSLYRLPVILLLVGCLVVSIVIVLTFLMWRSMVTPIEQLVRVSRRIAKNNFPEDDIVVENRDELGELVQTFNKMKQATVGYIGALQEKYEITQLLHKEELERVEIEKNLEATRLDVLKSQINPHFLFNTLNMIACMAKLEEADVTERMINSMSNLFRYNLKTTETEVPLSQELKIVDDYMYLQQMRFGDRIQYQKDISSEALERIIPSFSLQPIVENAIIHGLSSKVQGGRIFIRARIINQKLQITIMDTGVGMDKNRLRELRAALSQRKTSRTGIGLGNIYKRLHMMYEDADLLIYSKKNAGTVVQMKMALGNRKV